MCAPASPRRSSAQAAVLRDAGMTPRSPQAEALAFLDDPATHGGVRPVRIETHSAIVYLAGDTAYKVKREVTYPYMDFGTLEKRRAAIETEFALNLPVAPAIYRGVGAVRRAPDGHLFLDGGAAGDAAAGALVEPVLIMRRFDQADLLARIAEESPEDWTPRFADRLADAVIRFHRTAAPVIVTDAAVRFGRVIDGIHLDMREIGGPFARDGAAFAERARAQLRPLRGLLNARGQNGAVIRGHGDLHLGNCVRLDGEPTLFDRIEFNEAIAIVDRLYDLAFLLMDLARRGMIAPANRILNRWLDAFADEAALGFLPLAIATRAMVRASVLPRQAGLAADAATRARLNESSFATAAFAMARLERRAPRLLAVGGLSGTGKSALAAALAPDFAPLPGARVLRSDIIRKALHGIDAETALPASAYTRAESARVYAAMLARAESALNAGWPVILDAVFAAPAERDAAAALAAKTGVPFQGLFLRCDLATRRARIEHRARREQDASDATAALAAAQEAYDIGPLGAWTALPAGGDADAVLAAARGAITPATNG
jgi:aminoglycoside phosphotransferase family enzyme/predicted kinase